MGCFDVVCALTNVPIRTGEKCHLIILKKDLDWDDSVVWLAYYQGQYSIDAVFHGTYDDYGSIEPDHEITEAESHLLETFRDHMSEPDNRRLHFFVCDTAWKWAQERFDDYVPHWIKERRTMREMFTKAGEKPPEFLKEKEKDQQQIEMARLMTAFTFACKHPLAGLGNYHQYGGEEVERIKEHLQLVEKRLKEVEDFYKSIEEEED